ncbi:MAG: DUF58 domain-containing protein [Candidatus Lernaella stagnicola]|nr:DUF58 domain-containing protein [Candidatus Lernaella stagnicola]
MLTEDAIRRIRRVAITTRKEVETGFSGAYHSVFRGRGSQFDEVRPYQAGDPIRDIDWNVTARTGEPFVKIFREERELTLMLVVDASRSGLFGSVRSKRELAAEAAAILAFSAIESGDKVGLLRFTDRIEQYVPPRKGSRHVWRVIRDLLEGETKGRGTDIRTALAHVRKVRRHRAVVVLLSDFLAPFDYEKELRAAASRHDLIAAEVLDPLDLELPDVGLVEIEDAESGERRWIDTGAHNLRQQYADTATRHRERLNDFFVRNGVDLLTLRTDEGAVPPLKRFFELRRRRRR